MAVLLAVIAAAVYGIGDFLGGVVSRRVSAVTVLLYSYPIGAIVMAALSPLFGGGVSQRTLWWSLAGGVAGFVGVVSLYTGLARAPMNIVSPVSAVLAAGVPVAAGLMLAERPDAAAWVGMLVGLIAIVLIGQNDESARTDTGALAAGAAATTQSPARLRISQALALATLGGVGFGGYFVCLERADNDSGLWPVVLSRLTALVLVIAIATRQRSFIRLRGSTFLLATGTGVFDASANLFFLLAAREGYLSLASVITSLYPASTVLLAVLLLKERMRRIQQAGLALATVAVILIAS